MFIADNNQIVVSPRDIAAAHFCEYAMLRNLNYKLGVQEEVVNELDPMEARAVAMGKDLEADLVGRLIPVIGDGLIEIPALPKEHLTTYAALEQIAATTTEALKAGKDGVYQGYLFDGRVGGYPDFLLNGIAAAHITGHPTGAGVNVVDTKLGTRYTGSGKSKSRETLPAWLQLGAYAHLLLTNGFEVGPHLFIIQGDHTAAVAETDLIVGQFTNARNRVLSLVDQWAQKGQPIVWDPTNPDVKHCGTKTCRPCYEQVELVNNIRVLGQAVHHTYPPKFAKVGVHTVEQAAKVEEVAGVKPEGVEKVRHAAQLWLNQKTSDTDHHNKGGLPHMVPLLWELTNVDRLHALPAPTPDDWFFDFEGDPLWTDKPGHLVGGLEYLFGWVETPKTSGVLPEFHALWAHDRDEEWKAFDEFVYRVQKLRERNPNAHIYHYAPYEATALRKLAQRYGQHEETVEWIISNVFVDLLPVVSATINTGDLSHSLKTVERIYLPEQLRRTAEVKDAVSSVETYYLACLGRAQGNTELWEESLATLAEYNRDDCVSTWLLRDWLVALAHANPVTKTA